MQKYFAQFVKFSTVSTIHFLMCAKISRTSFNIFPAALSYLSEQETWKITYVSRFFLQIVKENYRHYVINSHLYISFSSIVTESLLTRIPVYSEIEYFLDEESTPFCTTFRVTQVALEQVRRKGPIVLVSYAHLPNDPGFHATIIFTDDPTNRDILLKDKAIASIMAKIGYEQIHCIIYKIGRSDKTPSTAIVFKTYKEAFKKTALSQNIHTIKLVSKISSSSKCIIQ